MLMELTPKSAFNGSSQRIFLLLLGSCKFFSLMWFHSCFTTCNKDSNNCFRRKWKRQHVMFNGILRRLKKRGQKLLSRCTSVLASSGTPINSCSCGERLHSLLKPPPPLFFASLLSLLELHYKEQ